jgi:SAM-dependent methyltransferase
VTGFADHYSRGAREYAAHRPGYPPALVARVAALCPRQGLAWDVGTGNGQAAHLLAAHFQAVRATDASAAQIGQATPHHRVTYAVAREDDSGLDAGSADLVTVAQALHWFDLTRFYAEVRRVLRPDGVVAAWCYGRVHVDTPVDRVVDAFYTRRVGRYWPPERRHVEVAYRDLPFPFDEVALDGGEMAARLSRGGFVGYVGTWSAVRRARDAEGQDPLREFAKELAVVWPDADQVRTVSWPIGLRVGRVAGSVSSGG